MTSCLVCGKITDKTHMKLDVCRACAIFYRRNKPVEAVLKCSEGTRRCANFQTEGNTSCRQCRLDRFNAVISICSKGSDIALDPSCSSSLTLPPPSIPPFIQEQTLIDRVRRYYQRLSAIRRYSELAFRGTIIEPHVESKEEYDVVPCTYQVMNHAVRIMISTLFDFAAALFPEFTELSLDDKWLLIRNFQCSFHCIESHMRSARYFSRESGKCFSTYTTYLSTDVSSAYFSDCINKSNAGEASKALAHAIRENCHRIRDHFDRVKPTDEEFMAMMSIAFWSIETTNAPDSLVVLSSRYRTQMLSNMMDRYRQTIGTAEGTIRLGELYGILDTIKTVEMNQKWEYEVYRMLDLFDDHTFMYKLQPHKSGLIHL